MAELKDYSLKSLSHQLEKEIAAADFYSLSTRMESWSKLENVYCAKIYRESTLFYQSNNDCHPFLSIWSYTINIPTQLNSKIVVTIKPTANFVLTLLILFLANILLIYIWINSQKKFTEELYRVELAWLKIARQAAHDIRSPLSALKMLSSVAKISIDQKDLLIRANERVEEIANDLLFKTNIRELSISIKEVQEHIKQTIQLFEKAVHKRPPNISLVVDQKIHPNLKVQASGPTLERILSNLINNSSEAANSHNLQIDILLKPSALGLQIVIRDNGKGMSPQTLRSVIENEFTTKKGGNGLGISGARHAIKSWDGLFSINSTELEGTTVTIDLKKLDTQINI